MIITLPVFKDSISPLFDSSKSLLSIRFSNKKEIKRVYSDIIKLSITEKAILIKELTPDIFICNAIGGFWYNYLTFNGIYVICGVHGKIETKVNDYMHGKFTIPGDIKDFKCRRFRGEQN